MGQTVKQTNLGCSLVYPDDRILVLKVKGWFCKPLLVFFAALTPGLAFCPADDGLVFGTSSDRNNDFPCKGTLHVIKHMKYMFAWLVNC